MHITYITWWLTAVRCHIIQWSMHLWLDQHDLIASQSPLTTTSYPSSVIGHWKVYWHLHNMFSYLINLPIRMVTGVYGSLPYLIRLYRDPNRATNVGPFKFRRTNTVPDPTGQKCWQYLRKMWAGSGTHMGNPHGTHMKMVDKNHMGCSYGPYIVAHMGPM